MRNTDTHTVISQFDKIFIYAVIVIVDEETADLPRSSMRRWVDPQLLLTYKCHFSGVGFYLYLFNQLIDRFSSMIGN